jgi:hypothetical protein
VTRVTRIDSMRLLVFFPFFISDPRHIDMLRVQSLLRDRLRQVAGSELEISSAACFDFVDERFRLQVDALESAFDFWADSSKVVARAGPHAKWGIRRPTSYAVDAIARNQTAPDEVFLLRVIQDTFVDDPRTLYEQLRLAAETGMKDRFITANIHHWPTNGHAYLCRAMRLPFNGIADYAQGALMMAPWRVWERYYLGLPAEIHHYWDDVMMSLWLTHEGGQLVNIPPDTFRHLHHCDPEVSQTIFQAHSAELQRQECAQ